MSAQYTYHNNAANNAVTWNERWYRVILPFLILALLVSMIGFAPASASANTDSRILPQLLREANANPDKKFRVIVQRMNRNTASDSDVPVRGGQKLKDLPASVDAFVAEMPGRALEALGKNPAVKFVSPDAPMVKTGIVDGSRVGTVYPQTVNAPGLWGDGITGLGVGVAIIDTGISGAPDWRDTTGKNRQDVKILFNSELEKTNDGHGHGTHVAGIVGGSSWHRSETALRGKYVGIAPEARLINVRVANEQGMSYVSDVVSAIDWTINNRTTHNIRVINLSLVSSVAESYRTSILSAVVEKAWFSGIFVVVAAGNAGPDTMYYPPANDPFVMTVGAADSVGTTARGDDGMAPWSSYGTTQDGFVKPDVVAPGRNIVSLRPSNSNTLSTLFPERIVDSYYIRLSGTSMAAPVVSGIAALAFQANPSLTNDQLKWLLMNTATPMGTRDANGDFQWLPGQGAGQVDATAVVRYVGTPSYANQNLQISSQLTIPDGSTNYSSASWSTASWSTASWSTASWSTASWSTASWSTASWSTATFSNANEADVQ